MKRTLGPLLLLLMLAAPLWARPPQKHLKAIAATGLPVYLLDQEYTASRISPKLPLYSTDYRIGEGRLRIYCCSAPYKGIPLTGSPLQNHQLGAGDLGGIRMNRYAHFCRTDWIRVPGGAMLIQADGIAWDRLVQVLEQIRRSPQPQQGNVYQLALQAAGLPRIRLGEEATFLEDFSLGAKPACDKTYLFERGSLRLSLTREAPTPGVYGAQVLARRTLRIPGLGPVTVLESLRNGRKTCSLSPVKVAGAYLRASSEEIPLSRFLNLIRQLQIIGESSLSISGG